MVDDTTTGTTTTPGTTVVTPEAPAAVTPETGDVPAGATVTDEDPNMTDDGDTAPDAATETPVPAPSDVPATGNTPETPAEPGAANPPLRFAKPCEKGPVGNNRAFFLC